jgi:hypothetical protein
VQPTDQCADILQRFNGQLTLFIEALEFQRMRSLSFDGYNSIETQIQRLLNNGHEAALHLHPQWPQASYANSTWQLDLKKWRIGDLSNEEAHEVVSLGLAYLSDLTTSKITVFRAGGWAIQPERHVLEALTARQVIIDSTVAPGAFNWARGDWFDFRSAPSLPYWQVSQNVCKNSLDGAILEVPIATHHIGRLAHVRALLEKRRKPGFPNGCHGSYAGPNSRLDSFTGKCAKVLGLGRVMLDFSALPASVLITTLRGLTERYADFPGPIPIVAIGHNKNFSDDSAEALAEMLHWVSSQESIALSSYDSWHQSLMQHRQEAS